LRAVAYRKPLPATDERALIDATLEQPKGEGRDLLVKGRGVVEHPLGGESIGCAELGAERETTVDHIRGLATAFRVFVLGLSSV
jgi:hypothetical protein